MGCIIIVCMASSLVTATTSPQSVIGLAGTELTLNCIATITGSAEIPTFEWLRNGSPPLSSSSMNSSNLTPGSISSQLTLNPLSQRSHLGVITCRVSVGSVTSTANVYVLVNGKIL